MGSGALKNDQSKALKILKADSKPPWVYASSCCHFTQGPSEIPCFFQSSSFTRGFTYVMIGSIPQQPASCGGAWRHFNACQGRASRFSLYTVGDQKD